MFIQGTHAAQQERESRGYVWLWPGIFIPSAATVATIELRTWFVAQEQPWHPRPFTAHGVPPRTIPPPTNSVILTRELPWHPGTFIFGVPLAQLIPLPPGRRQWTITQEQPWHPGSFIVGGPPPSGPVQPGRRIWTITQEQPWHPGPWTWQGVSPVSHIAGRGTAFGYIL